MSAFVVPRSHIDALVFTASRDFGGKWKAPIHWFVSDPDGGPPIRNEAVDLDALGKLLLIENVRAVQATYPELTLSDLPGPIGLPFLLAGYRYQKPHRHYSAIELLKALSTFEYQTCASLSWFQSEVREVCGVLRHRLIVELPDFDDAPWVIDDSLTIEPSATGADSPRSATRRRSSR